MVVDGGGGWWRVGGGGNISGIKTASMARGISLGQMQNIEFHLTKLSQDAVNQQFF